MQKQAGLTDDMKKVFSTIWRSNEGPFENMLRIVSYSMPFFGGIFGAILLIVDKVASYFWGYSLEDFGKYIDKLIGLSPGSEISEEKLHSALLKELQSKANTKNDKITKLALWGGITGALLKTKIVTIFLMKLAGWFMAAYAVGNMQELYEKIKEPVEKVKNKIEDEVVEHATKNMLNQNMGDLTNIFGK